MDKGKLLEFIRKSKSDYASVINKRISDFSYRSKRYGHHFSLTIGLSDFGVDLRGYCDYIRQTDEFIVLENNLCCIILDCAPSHKGLKAANNMLSGFQSHHFAKSLYSSVVSSDEYEEDHKMIDELFYVLEYTINNNMDNIVVDPGYMLKH